MSTWDKIENIFKNKVKGIKNWYASNDVKNKMHGRATAFIAHKEEELVIFAYAKRHKIEKVFRLSPGTITEDMCRSLVREFVTPLLYWFVAKWF